MLLLGFGGFFVESPTIDTILQELHVVAILGMVSSRFFYHRHYHYGVVFSLLRCLGGLYLDSPTIITTVM